MNVPMVQVSFSDCEGGLKGLECPCTKAEAKTRGISSGFPNDDYKTHQWGRPADQETETRPFA
jgi:glutamine synthetase